jgi:tetratricopeptide (TPR) repeat protein
VIVPLLAAALLAAPPDACAPVPPAALRDPAGAAAYLEVADDERAAGRADSAVLAYRAALERDPGLSRARTALAQLCAVSRGDAAFARGLARVRAGDCQGALPALEEARAAGDAAAALLVGLCRTRLGEDEAAAAALREAQAAPDTRAAAELYLGLLALRGGRPGEASPLFQSATADPALAPVARELARQARREGKVVVSLLGEVGWDSNVTLAPGGQLAPAGAGDGLGSLTGLVTVAPWLDRGPYARAAITWEQQARRHAFDLLALSGAAGVPLGSDRRRLLLEYGYDLRRVGGQTYLSAHRLLVDGRAAVNGAWTVGAAYALRGERYLPADAADDSGLRHGAQLDVTATPGGWRLTAAGQGAWHGARVAARGYREAGPLLALATPASGRLRAVVELAYTWRDYAAVDPGFERRRRDAYLDVAGRLEVDLRDRWTAYLSLAGRRASSSVAELRYARVVPTAGLSFTAGLP